MQKQELKRKISLEEDFMSHKSGSDILYGFMVSKATFHPETKQLYLTKYRFTKLKPYLKIIFNERGRTFVSDNLDKLKKAGFIQETTLICAGKPTACYTFPNDNFEKYRLVNNEMLLYVVYTRNSCAIRIYTYLYNKYDWKRKQKEEYDFTITELRSVLGWAPTSRTCNEIIEMNLQSFAREGIIRYSEGFQEDENGVTHPIKTLHFVAARLEELNKLNEGIVKSIERIKNI